jgi:hypothetical protein
MELSARPETVSILCIQFRLNLGTTVPLQLRFFKHLPRRMKYAHTGKL